MAKENPVDWLESLFNADRRKVLGESDLVPRPRIGEMVAFRYNPKHKNKLPYYDSFPLIFPFREDASTFTGINFHYLNIQYRIILMDSLIKLSANGKITENTRLNLSWQLLKSTSTINYVRPCVKRYLKSNVSGGFRKIKPDNWGTALELPVVDRFNKSTASRVWNESSIKITRGRN